MGVVKGDRLVHAMRAQAGALATYLAKPGNRGADFWLRSKDFSPGERAAILVAFRELQEDNR